MILDFDKIARAGKLALAFGIQNPGSSNFLISLKKIANFEKLSCVDNLLSYSLPCIIHPFGIMHHCQWSIFNFQLLVC